MPKTSDSPPGRLLASGRQADVYALDDRRVLRRYRQLHDTEREAMVIEHVRAHGYPTPAVHDVGPFDLVLDRIRGRTMAADIARRPWTFAASTRTLAVLHDRLHAIPAPDWLEHAPAGDGACVVHLDLHPLNVIMGPSGPAVIDWTNGARGSGAVDVALTWLLLLTGDPDDRGLLRVVAAHARDRFADRFARAADPDGVALQTGLDDAAGYRLTDPSLRELERRAIVRVLGAMRAR